MSVENRSAPGGGDTFSRMAGELAELFAGGVDAPWDDEAFNDVAMRVFSHQLASNPTYRSFCAAKGASPGTVARWEDVPAVPATAFKHLDLVSSDGGAAEVVFRTSGTTGGHGARGRHLVPSLALYRASLLPNFRAALLPEGRRLPLLSLIPTPADAPDSSLSSMIGTVADELCDGAHWLVDREGRLDVDGFLEAAADLEAGGGRRW